jgi:hypothetical protein
MQALEGAMRRIPKESRPPPAHTPEKVIAECDDALLQEVVDVFAAISTVPTRTPHGSAATSAPYSSRTRLLAVRGDIAPAPLDAPLAHEEVTLAPDVAPHRGSDRRYAIALLQAPPRRIIGQCVERNLLATTARTQHRDMPKVLALPNCIQRHRLKLIGLFLTVDHVVDLWTRRRWWRGLPAKEALKPGP